MWSDLLKVALPLVTLPAVLPLPARHPVPTATWSPRSRPCGHERDEIEASLNAAGFEVDEVLDAPGRLGLGWVFVARRP
jgi:hypothetical protein